MNKEELKNALDVIEAEYQNDIRETQARVNKIKKKLSHISDLKAKYAANVFTVEEAAIVDEYESYTFWRLQCFQRKNEKIIALKKKLENESKELLKSIEEYSNVIQGTATNKLSKVRAKNKDFKVAPYSKIGETTQKIGKDEFTVILKNFSEDSCLKPSTHKLLTALLIEFTENNSKDTKVELPLKKYMAMRGIKDEDSARRQVDEDLERLFDLSIRFQQGTRKNRKYSRNYLDMRFVIKKGIKNGIISCTFAPDFYEVLKNYTVMPMAKKALMLDDRYNPHAFFFLKFLCEYVNMNYGKPNQNVISVESLLKSSPEMPLYEDIQKGDRDYKRKIIEPFIRDLNVLAEMNVIKWRLEPENALDNWNNFIKAKVYFELLNYPVRALPEREKAGRKKSEKASNDKVLFTDSEIARFFA